MYGSRLYIKLKKQLDQKAKRAMELMGVLKEMELSGRRSDPGLRSKYFQARAAFEQSEGNGCAISESIKCLDALIKAADACIIDQGNSSSAGGGRGGRGGRGGGGGEDPTAAPAAPVSSNPSTSTQSLSTPTLLFNHLTGESVREEDPSKEDLSEEDPSKGDPSP